MGAERTYHPGHGAYSPQPAEEITSGNYNAQRQLDFRLASGGTLRIISPLEELSDDERDFQIAMKRRKEPKGASLEQMGKKYGL
jgi:hypothetical protein